MTETGNCRGKGVGNSTCEPSDLRPKKDSAVVDKGLRLPNINDRFAGKVSDVGAYEAEWELTDYGPRPRRFGRRNKGFCVVRNECRGVNSF